MVKGMSRQSYERGVVLVRCPGCQNLHLVADRLGWFGAPGSIEDFVSQRGESVLRCAVDGTFELTPEQLEAWRGASSRGGGFFELAGSRRPAAAAAASRVGSLSPTVLPLNGAGAASQDGGDEPDKPGE